MTTQVLKILGTVADVHVGGVTPRRAAKLEQLIVDEIRRLESIFNLFDPCSDINRLREQGSTAVPELSEVQNLAVRWEQQSRGSFSPFVDQLRSLWLEAELVQRVPTEATLADVADQLRTAHPTAHLNLNAIAKGWIVDRSLDVLFEIRRPPSTGWVSIGGDVAHRGQGSVVVGIEDPFRPFDNATPIRSVRLSDQALATSGGARRFWTIDGQQFSHLIDPRSGWPVDHIASATVIADDAADADAMATAATVLLPAESVALIAATPNAACLIIEADRTVHTSANWPES